MEIFEDCIRYIGRVRLDSKHNQSSSNGVTSGLKWRKESVLAIANKIILEEMKESVLAIANKIILEDMDRIPRGNTNKRQKNDTEQENPSDQSYQLQIFEEMCT